MIKYYLTAPDGTHQIDAPAPGCWISLVAPTEEELRSVSEYRALDMDILKAALDLDERSRIDADEGYTMVLVNIPTVEERTDIDLYRRNWRRSRCGKKSRFGKIVKKCRREHVIARRAKPDVAIPLFLPCVVGVTSIYGIPTPVCALARNDVVLGTIPPHKSAAVKFTWRYFLPKHPDSVPDNASAPAIRPGNSG